MSSVEAILVVDNVSKEYRVPGARTTRRVVDGVSLRISESETLALVGESGSGKSTLARLSLGLIRADAGEIWFLGKRRSDLHGSQLRTHWARQQPIFQDPTASLNPRRSVGSTLFQAVAMRGLRESLVGERSLELLKAVGLTPPQMYMKRYPHEISGGQRQRVAIARAIAMDPVLLIADEPLTGVDVSIRGQILNILLALQQRLKLSMLFVTHDMSIAAAIAHRVAVMKDGVIVEEGTAHEVLAHPHHPYTQRLMSAVPRLGEVRATRALTSDLWGLPSIDQERR